MDNKKFEQLIDLIINENEEQAKESKFSVFEKLADSQSKTCKTLGEVLKIQQPLPIYCSHCCFNLDPLKLFLGLSRFTTMCNTSNIVFCNNFVNDFLEDSS